MRVVCLTVCYVIGIKFPVNGVQLWSLAVPMHIIIVKCEIKYVTIRAAKFVFDDPIMVPMHGTSFWCLMTF